MAASSPPKQTVTLGPRTAGAVPIQGEAFLFVPPLVTAAEQVARYHREGGSREKSMNVRPIGSIRPVGVHCRRATSVGGRSYLR